MAFTNVDLVKKHIFEKNLGTEKIENLLFQLLGKDYSQLPHTHIQTDSEKVKGKESLSPTEEEISFTSGDRVSLSHSELIPETFVAASDSSLGKIYTENLDYAVDYEDGKITRLSSGSIPSGASVVVWYLFYKIYQKNSDYQIDYLNGKIKRIQNGAIEDGQWIWIDYQTEFGLLSDEVTSVAITEANDRILKSIDPSFHNSTDQSLVTAETYLAVSNLCNIKANQEINLGKWGNKTDEVSKAWVRMADSYKNEALAILKNFAKKSDDFHSPQAIKSEN
jgi:hypothetical protein